MIESYDVPRKFHWRHWQWNQIADRLSAGIVGSKRDKEKSLADKIVLYLVGPDDRDRECAIARGFAPHNLIAVDLREGNISNSKSGGNLGIHGDLLDCILSWPEPKRLDAVVADTCSALTWRAMNMALLLAGIKCSSREVIIAINLQRGRDKDCNWLRERQARNLIFQQSPKFGKPYVIVENASELNALTSEQKNRAKMFVLLALGSACAKRSWKPLENKEDTIKWSRLFQLMNPAYHSYRSSNDSSNVYMDSAVFNMPLCNEEGHGIYSRARQSCRKSRAGKRTVAVAATHTRIVRRLPLMASGQNDFDFVPQSMLNMRLKQN